MKRRTFFKFGLSSAALAILKSKNIYAGFNQQDRLNNHLIKRNNIVISTWSHGIKANDEAWRILSEGGKSIDAVEAGVRVTEADITNRSVGIGGRPDRDGHVTLDACIMDENSRCGSVACLEGIKHPISVARAVMEKTPHVMLVGDGAKEFAVQQGFEKCKTPIKEVKKDWKAWKKENKDLLKKPNINHENHDTIGMLAMDEYGNMSGSCTTSGWAYKMHGRVGDSPIIGAGLFIDNEVGGACATGMGEAIIRIAGSHTVVELMRQGKTPQEACKIAVERIISKHTDLTGLQCGFLAMDMFGRVGSYSVYSGFNYAIQKEDGKNEMINSDFDIEC
ncbi:MAG: N(4)-(beta-N-acetylglucosaminyl)-L-asparaginase [Bacteroidota bacterium]|nr:N(4)-(beta-N-acetylglucosaminyl)-L-asparaginase [Bacteroidota bacterium]